MIYQFSELTSLFCVSLKVNARTHKNSGLFSTTDNMGYIRLSMNDSLYYSFSMSGNCSTMPKLKLNRCWIYGMDE